VIFYFLMGRATPQYIARQRARYKCFYLWFMLTCSCVLEKNLANLIHFNTGA
jgi:hypothetical protein